MLLQHSKSCGPATPTSKVAAPLNIQKVETAHHSGLKIDHHRITLSDGAVAQSHTLTIPKDCKSGLGWHPYLIQKGIKTAGLLMDVKETAKLWSSSDFCLNLERVTPPSSISFISSHYGWQFGQFALTKNGGDVKVHRAANDETLSGSFEVLLNFSDRGWEFSRVVLEKGELVSSGELSKLRHGFSIPKVLHLDGRIGYDPLDPRVMGEVRNFIDWGCGVQFNRDDRDAFFHRMRQIGGALNREQVRGLVTGTSGVLQISLAAKELVGIAVELGEFLSRHPKLSEYLDLTGVQSESPVLRVLKPLPRNRIPLFILWSKGEGDGSLYITGVPGRYPENGSGVTVEEGAQLVRELGAKEAAFGPAGQDVCFVHREGLGKPAQLMPLSGRDANGHPMHRPVPSFMWVSK